MAFIFKNFISLPLTLAFQTNGCDISCWHGDIPSQELKKKRYQVQSLMKTEEVAPMTTYITNLKATHHHPHNCYQRSRLKTGQTKIHADP